MSQTPRLEEVLDTAFNERMSNIWTAVPASIKRYDSAKQVVTVQFDIVSTWTDGGGDVITPEHPSISGVPVMFPGGSTATQEFRITWPLRAGDKGLFIVSSLPTGGWKMNGGAKQVVNTSKNPDIRNTIACNGFFIPGAHAGIGPTQAPSDAMVLWGNKIKLGGVNETEPTIMGETLKYHLDDVLDKLQTFLSTILAGNSGGNILSDTGTAKSALNTSISNFQSSWNGILTDVVEVK